jgi:SpoVK/Ycf46/Vps4 family AAA+-type ATPase
MLFADKKVDTNLISLNRVMLLYGPPGTGKTSLCKALAQKLSIRLASRYPQTLLVEINAHSLFSKWFSESGKLVMRLFKKIHDLVDDPDTFVCILIGMHLMEYFFGGSFFILDEVESLTAARQAALSNSEPSDSIRVVNAILTQLDLLKTRKNVLIMTTSNITEAIDLAFLDRVDIKQFIGPPSHAARLKILCDCIGELHRVGLLDCPLVRISSSLNDPL